MARSRDAARVAFVLGCQRSGTTMLIDALGRAADIVAFGESDAPVMDGMRLTSIDALRTVQA